MKKFTYVLFILPFVLGFCGLLSAGDNSILDAAFWSLQMYFLNYEESAPNLAVEIARWIAPLVTAGGILAFFMRYLMAARNFLRRLRFPKDNVAIFGETSEADFLRKVYADRLVLWQDKEFVKASRYVLFDTEERNLEFYALHRQELKDSPVCLLCDSFKTQDFAGDMIRPFHFEETAARLFWHRHSLYPVAKQNNFCLTIAIMGFDSLGQELLLRGLQDNIFHEKQQVEYHVFGTEEQMKEFSNLYHQIPMLSDRVIYHKNLFDHLDTIAKANRVIVAQQEGQMDLIQKLLFACGDIQIHVLSMVTDGLSLLEAQENLTVFDWKKEILNEEYLFADTLYDQAKRINMRYAQIYFGAEDTPENRQLEWNKLNSFTKYSNISAADYHHIRKEMLRDWGFDVDAKDFTVKQLSAEQLETLAHLEHIRWCRYHYLANWKYGKPENGKAKDPVARIHADLVPYEELSEIDKEKDRENIRVLLSV